jgi:uncharacterized membrane protein YGL010W
MKTGLEQLTNYAAYHRDRRNPSGRCAHDCAGSHHVVITSGL